MPFFGGKQGFSSKSKDTNSVTVCQNSVFAKFWVIKNEVFEKKIAFFLFYVGEIETKKRKKNGKDQKTL